VSLILENKAKDSVKTSVSTFHIFNNLLRDAGAIALSPLFAASPLLANVRVSATRIGEKGMESLIAGLLRSGTVSLSALDVSDNRLGSSSQKGLPLTLLIGRQKNSTLCLLNLADLSFGAATMEMLCKKFSKAVVSNLRVLNLNYNDIGQKVIVRDFAPSLAFMPLLEELQLESNEVGTDGCIEICKALLPHKALRRLNLSHNEISTKAAPYISRCIGNKDQWNALDLSGNSIHPSGIQLILVSILKVGGDESRQELSDNDASDEEPI